MNRYTSFLSSGRYQLNGKKREQDLFLTAGESKLEGSSSLLPSSGFRLPFFFQLSITKRFLFPLVSLLIFFACQSETQTKKERGFNESKIEAYNRSDSYNYDREFENRPDKEVDSEPNWFLRALGNFISFIAGIFNTVIGFVFLLGLVAGLVYIIVKNSDKIFVNKNSTTSSNVKIIREENIEEVDYEKLLQIALKENNHALAIRYKFLSCLKYLQISRLIKWHKEKTNYEYLQEVPVEYYSTLDKLINVYEYIWYGKFPASYETYKAVEAKVHELYSLKKS